MPSAGSRYTIGATAQSARLISGLRKKRAALNKGKQGWHPTAKGDASELPWREVIGNFLPERYCCSQAFVIDADGECSEQVDVLIHDRQYSPLLFRQGPHLYVPAESVYVRVRKPEVVLNPPVEYAAVVASRP